MKLPNVAFIFTAESERHGRVKDCQPLAPYTQRSATSERDQGVRVQ